TTPPQEARRPRSPRRRQLRPARPLRPEVLRRQHRDAAPDRPTRARAPTSHSSRGAPPLADHIHDQEEGPTITSTPANMNPDDNYRTTTTPTTTTADHR